MYLSLSLSLSLSIYYIHIFVYIYIHTYIELVIHLSTPVTNSYSNYGRVVRRPGGRGSEEQDGPFAGRCSGFVLADCFVGGALQRGLVDGFVVMMAMGKKTREKTRVWRGETAMVDSMSTRPGFWTADAPKKIPEILGKAPHPILGDSSSRFPMATAASTTFLQLVVCWDWSMSLWTARIWLCSIYCSIHPQIHKSID